MATARSLPVPTPSLASYVFRLLADAHPAGRDVHFPYQIPFRTAKQASGDVMPRPQFALSTSVEVAPSFAREVKSAAQAAVTVSGGQRCGYR